jgi:hypothetical protein
LSDDVDSTKKKLEYFKLMEKLQQNNEVLADIDYEQAEGSGNKSLAERHANIYYDEIQKTNSVVDGHNAADEAHYQAMKKKTNFISNESNSSDEPVTTIESPKQLIDGKEKSTSRKRLMEEEEEETSDYSVTSIKRMTTWNDLDEELFKKDDDKETDERNDSRNNDYDNDKRDDGDDICMKTQGYTIFIQNLPRNITKQELEVIFDQNEIIKDVKKANVQKIMIYKDKITGESNGEATITYEDEETAKAAVNLHNGKEILSSVVQIKLISRGASTFNDRNEFHDGDQRYDDDYRGEGPSGDDTRNYYG